MNALPKIDVKQLPDCAPITAAGRVSVVEVRPFASRQGADAYIDQMLLTGLACSRVHQGYTWTVTVMSFRG